MIKVNYANKPICILKLHELQLMIFILSRVPQFFWLGFRIITPLFKLYIIL